MYVYYDRPIICCFNSFFKDLIAALPLMQHQDLKLSNTVE